jgi:hypothetical protein
VVDGPLVAAAVQNLDSGPLNVLVLVVDELEDRVDDPVAADSGQRIGGP